MTTQKKFEEHLARIAEQHKLDLVIDNTYANLGSYSFEERGSFDPIMAFPFAWSNRSGNFDGNNSNNGTNVKPLREYVGGSDANPAGIWHVTGEHLDEALRRINSRLYTLIEERDKARTDELVEELTS